MPGLSEPILVSHVLQGYWEGWVEADIVPCGRFGG